MAPFRLPFSSKKHSITTTEIPVNDNNDENLSPAYKREQRERPSLALGLKERHDEPNEFKLSSVNGSGEYLPPSPNEKKGTFWGKSPSTVSTAHRSVFSDNEPFSISRESFESYRRSFDISGRSPVTYGGESFNSRTSLDSRRLPPRTSLSSDTFSRLPSSVSDVTDERFEEVGLNDDPVHQPKKRGFLSRFSENNNSNNNNNELDKPTSNGEVKSHHFHILSGRKRGQSGTGSELGNMNTSRPDSRGKVELSAR